MLKRKLLTALVAALLLVGCDTTGAPATQPANQPVATTVPNSTNPTQGTMVEPTRDPNQTYPPPAPVAPAPSTNSAYPTPTP